jgi:hypothetical protein
MSQTVNVANQEQLTFVGQEITYLVQLVDEIPTKYGKNFLNLFAAVKQKRAQEQKDQLSQQPKAKSVKVAEETSEEQPKGKA